MSTAEEFFAEEDEDAKLRANFPLADALLGSKEEVEAFDVMQALWGDDRIENGVSLEAKFVAIRAMFAEFRQSCGTFTESNWQSYHAVPTSDGRRHVWVVGEEFPPSLHIVATREVNKGLAQELSYAEFVVGAEHNLISRRQGFARKANARTDGWTRETLGSAAVIEVYGDGRLNFVRGSKNVRPTFVKYSTPYLASAPIARWSADIAAECALDAIGGLLSPLSSGGCYEAGVTGAFR